MIRKITFAWILLGVLSSARTFAQEVRPLTENPVIKRYRVDHPASLNRVKDGTLLTLPFFDDFSSSSVVPDPAKWADQDVYINNSFGYDPISIGVATLDAIDKNGDLYAQGNAPTSSDKLTSLPFDLSAYAAEGSDTVMLSFYFQAGGNGEVPDIQDSLLLEFYSPANAAWQRVWYAISDTFSLFQPLIMPVPRSYCQSGFRFRFRNYTTVSLNDVSGGQGALSNVDCWNIDYIMLDALPRSAHLKPNDITLTEPPRYLLDYYESVPWTHLNDAQSITRNTMHYIIRNLSGDTVNIGRNYYVHNLHTGTRTFYDEYYTELAPASFNRIDDPFFAPFTRADNSNTGSFEVGGYIITPPGQIKQNDTCRTVLNFSDYYAYDDGSPEYGFGISGESTAGALLACRFRIFRPDTLRAVDMLFNKTRGNFNAGLGFHLCVWKDDQGIPGRLIYMSNNIYTPGDPTGMPGFTRYRIEGDTGIVVTDTSIFVGWKQVTEDFLNLGYDVNRNTLPRVFVNISGDWFNPGGSLIPGTPMIRAVFGGKETVTGTYDNPGTQLLIRVYPNPAVDVLYIETGDLRIDRIRLFDLHGRLVADVSHNTGTLDVSAFPSGLYLLQITPSGQIPVYRKVILSR